MRAQCHWSFRFWMMHAGALVRRHGEESIMQINVGSIPGVNGFGLSSGNHAPQGRL